MIISKSGITAGQQTATGDAILPPDMLDNPAAIQDLWFARLYALKPLIVLTLGPVLDCVRRCSAFFAW